MKPETPSQRTTWLALLVLLSAILSVTIACDAPPTVEPTVNPTCTPPPQATITLTPTLTPTPEWPVTVFVPGGMPAQLLSSISATLAAHEDLFAMTTSAADADVRVTLSADEGSDLLAEWVYAVVAPFPTLTDEISWQDVVGAWEGTSDGPFPGKPLMITAEIAGILASSLGDPNPSAIEIVSADQILGMAWDQQPSWAIVPFEQLEPRWKVLRVDGMSVLDKDLRTADYPLALRVGVVGLDRGTAKLRELLGPSLTNRDIGKMTTLMMTGVTALTRATALRMDRNGPTYPAQDIREWLREPDLTHISNEVSFAEDCPPPSNYTTMVFCSDPSYIELLDDTNIDVVELTGNHLLDWGVDAMKLSLRTYDERGMRYFGGGWDKTQAQSPLVVTSGIHTFGFIGCNPVGPASDWATDDRPGSAPCDYAKMYQQIAELRAQDIIPIATLQYWEFYQFDPTLKQREDFRALAEAGAVIVSGSQAHQPQGFEFFDGSYIHYGLGNLWFDQMWSLETREEFLDRHVFYDGRHISTELLTAILEDYSRPRPMTSDERRALLTSAFEASGWTPAGSGETLTQ